jgi:hypothetical protein
MGWRDAVPRGGRRVGWVRWARKAVRTWCYCEKKKIKGKKRKEKKRKGRWAARSGPKYKNE